MGTLVLGYFMPRPDIFVGIEPVLFVGTIDVVAGSAVYYEDR